MHKLNTKQVQYLKGKAHKIKPVVSIGNNGLTEGVLSEIEIALAHHELIKVKIAGADKETKNLIAETISQKTESYFVQHIGNMIVLFKQDEKSKYQLP